MERYVRWYRDGYMSSTGRCFDIGNTVSDALARFQATGEPFAGSTDRYSAGNGSLMRLAPVAMYYAANAALAIDRAARSSRTTHGAPQAVDACPVLLRAAGGRTWRRGQADAACARLLAGGRPVGARPA